MGRKSDVAAGNTITFNSVIANIGDSMEASSGTFTAKRKGLYTFSFSGPMENNEGSESKRVVIAVKKNENTLFILQDKTAESFESNTAFSWMLQLDEGNTINLSLNGSGLHGCGNEWIQFTGQLIHAN